MPKQTIIIRDDILRRQVIDHISRLNLAKPWAVTIEQYRKTRTPSQNALYWRWLDDVVKHAHEHTGQDKDDIHEWLKAKFLTPRVIEINGEVHRHFSTRKLDTAEMAEYTDKVYAWATSELGLFLLLPEELHNL